MTQDKARKTATRQRMAETGEPYSVARHAVENEAAGADCGGPEEAGRGRSYVEQARDSPFQWAEPSGVRIDQVSEWNRSTKNGAALVRKSHGRP